MRGCKGRPRPPLARHSDAVARRHDGTDGSRGHDRGSTEALVEVLDTNERFIHAVAAVLQGQGRDLPKPLHRKARTKASTATRSSSCAHDTSPRGLASTKPGYPATPAENQCRQSFRRRLHVGRTLPFFFQRKRCLGVGTVRADGVGVNLKAFMDSCLAKKMPTGLNYLVILVVDAFLRRQTSAVRLGMHTRRRDARISTAPLRAQSKHAAHTGRTTRCRTVAHCPSSSTEVRWFGAHTRSCYIASGTKYGTTVTWRTRIGCCWSLSTPHLVLYIKEKMPQSPKILVLSPPLRPCQ